MANFVLQCPFYCSSLLAKMNAIVFCSEKSKRNYQSYLPLSLSNFKHANGGMIRTSQQIGSTFLFLHNT